MFRVALLAVIAAVALSSEEAEVALDSPRILASKFLQSMYAVEHMDLVIEYSLYNTGDKTAYHVTLNDVHSFPTNSFEIIKGQLSATFERIAPGANVTHSVVVRPNQTGVFNYTEAQITYKVSETASDARVGYTNAPGEGYIYRLKEYERRFAPKCSYWIVFFLILAPTTLGSFWQYYSSKSKYEALDKKKGQ